jgi:hypothetical protein
MKAQASSNLKAQAPGGGGTRPQALDTFKVNATWRRRRLRQIVARQSVILTRDPRSKHQGSSCVNLSYIFLIKKMRLSFYVNLTNGGKNGINLRLQAHRYQQLERRRSSSGSRILLGDDVNRNAGGYRKELEGNFIPDLILTKDWLWSLDRRHSRRKAAAYAQKINWLWYQCWEQIPSQFHEKMDEARGTKNPGQHSSLTSGPGREIAPGFLIIIMNNCDKAQASSWTKAQALGGTRPQARCAVMSH